MPFINLFAAELRTALTALDALLDTPAETQLSFHKKTYRQLAKNWQQSIVDLENQQALLALLTKPAVDAYKNSNILARFVSRCTDSEIVAQVIWHAHRDCVIELMQAQAACIALAKKDTWKNRDDLKTALHAYTKLQVNEWLPKAWEWQMTLGRVNQLAQDFIKQLDGRVISTAVLEIKVESKVVSVRHTNNLPKLIEKSSIDRLSILPEDLLLMACTYLTPEDIVQCAFVAKLFKKYSKLNDIWLPRLEGNLTTLKLNTEGELKKIYLQNPTMRKALLISHTFTAEQSYNAISAMQIRRPIACANDISVPVALTVAKALPPGGKFIFTAEMSLELRVIITKNLAMWSGIMLPNTISVNDALSLAFVLPPDRTIYLPAQATESAATRVAQTVRAGCIVALSGNIASQVAVAVARSLTNGVMLSVAATVPATVALAAIQALNPGTIFVLKQDFPPAFAQQAVRALPAECKLFLSAHVTPKRVAAVLSVFQAKSVYLHPALPLDIALMIVKRLRGGRVDLHSTLSPQIMVAIARALSIKHVLVLNAEMPKQIAMALAQGLQAGCVMSLDSNMPLDLMLATVKVLATECELLLRAEMSLQNAVTVTKSLPPGCLLKIPAAMPQDIATAVIRVLPAYCAFSLCSEMSLAKIYALVSILPAGCGLILPADLSRDKAMAVIEVLPWPCKLRCAATMPQKLKKIIALAMQYRSAQLPELRAELLSQLSQKYPQYTTLFKLPPTVIAHAQAQPQLSPSLGVFLTNR